MRGAAEGGSSFRFLRSPLQTRYDSSAASSSRLRRGGVEVILFFSALSLKRARQFVKAFGERGGNLHVT